MNRSLLANVAACCAALCAGTSVVVTRFAVGEIDPVTLAFYRYAIAMICLLPVLPFVWPKARVPAADVITIALLGAVFFGFFPWAFSAGLQYTTAARGAIGIATIPIQTLIVATIFGREKLTRRNLLSVALGFAGIAIVFGPEAYLGEVSRHWLGDGLMLLGGLSAAIYSVFGRPMFGKHGRCVLVIANPDTHFESGLRRLCPEPGSNDSYLLSFPERVRHVRVFTPQETEISSTVSFSIPQSWYAQYRLMVNWLMQ